MIFVADITSPRGADNPTGLWAVLGYFFAMGFCVQEYCGITKKSVCIVMPGNNNNS